jgi:hypothetical protein
MSDEDYNQSRPEATHTDEFNQDIPTVPAVPLRQVTRAKVGQRVVHPDFGEGKVIEVEGSGEHAKATIFFANGAKKKLLLKYAPLEFV